MSEEIKVITYQSANAKPDERWIGYVVLPNGQNWQVRFSGSDEQSVIANAKTVYVAERAKQTKLRGSLNSETDKDMPADSSTHHFSGKMWVVNRTTHDLKRIEPSELAGYEANGYVRGGPRSK